ncbi:hypothetical protein LCGC14_1642230 [marine sediment metagenome]|uniref:Uncharacterized protein n=1 Tax=marine sediment metagenome TaxID=412755 RepID=A0A0F9KYY9_9ZZZZ
MTEMKIYYEVKTGLYATKKEIEELEAIRFNDPIRFNDKLHDLIKARLIEFKVKEENRQLSKNGVIKSHSQNEDIKLKKHDSLDGNGQWNGDYES